MASDPRTVHHDNSRHKVCGLCLNEHGLKPVRSISAKEESIIQDKVNKCFNLKDEKYCTGICNTCRTQLLRFESGSSNLLFLSSQFGADLPPVTRNNSKDKCDCIICCRAKLFGGQWNAFKKQMKDIRKDASRLSETATGDHRPLCPTCLSEIYRGSNHSEEECRKKHTLVENLSKIDTKLLEDALKAKSSGDNSSSSVNNNVDDDSSRVWTVKDAVVVQKDLNLSTRKRNAMMKFIRLKGNKVEPHIREIIQAEKAQLSEFYKTSVVEFQSSNGESLLKPIAFTDDPNCLLDFVDNERGKTEMVRKVGLDGGKGFLKMMCSSISIDDLQPTKKSRVTKADGIVGSDQKQCSGEKIVPLAVAPDVPETYHNIKILLKLCNLEQLDLVFTGDLKIYNIMLG